MKNGEIARVFQDIVDLPELKGENSFTIGAYQKVIRSNEHLPVEMEQLVAEDKLKEVPEIGEAITREITELLTTERLDYYDKLKAGFPDGISTLLDILSIVPKTATLLSSKLDIKSVVGLEAAIVGGKMASLTVWGVR